MHLTTEQYAEIANTYIEAQADEERIDILPVNEGVIESVIELFYEPSDYWQWHPDPLLVEVIEDVIGYGISELTEEGLSPHEYEELRTLARKVTSGGIVAVARSAGINIAAALVVSLMFFGSLV